MYICICIYICGRATPTKFRICVLPSSSSTTTPKQKCEECIGICMYIFIFILLIFIHVCMYVYKYIERDCASASCHLHLREETPMQEKCESCESCTYVYMSNVGIYVYMYVYIYIGIYSRQVAHLRFTILVLEKRDLINTVYTIYIC